VRNASTDKNQAARNDVTACYSAGDAGEKTAEQGILEKSIV
jgi:hypothetical protein